MTASQPPSSEFSFPLDPGLDAELEAAFERNIAAGSASAEVLATAGIAAAVGNKLSQVQPNTLSVAVEVRAWAEPQLQSMVDKWDPYGLMAGTFDPSLAGKPAMPNFAPTINRLFEARQALIESGDVTPDGESIGETMRLVAIPWQSFRDNLHRIPELLQDLRSTQGLTSADYINEEIVERFTNNKELYRVDRPTEIELLSAKDYLEHKIASDGAWGIMLMQTSNSAGVERLKGQSPDALTGEGRLSMAIAGQRVDALGIFEWLALTLQEDPKQLSTQDYSWMLANRLIVNVNGAARVPGGGWNDDLVRSGLSGSDNTHGDVRPRLAVM